MEPLVSLPAIMTTFEQRYRQYLTIFNGELKDRESLRNADVQFNAVYHYKVQSTEYDRRVPINRGQLQHLHELHLSLKSKVTLLHLRTVSLNVVDVKYRVVNEQEDTIVHNILTIEDNKIVKVQQKEEYYEEMLGWLTESNVLELS
jgi:flagellar capping protein FliD